MHTFFTENLQKIMPYKGTYSVSGLLALKTDLKYPF